MYPRQPLQRTGFGNLIQTQSVPFRDGILLPMLVEQHSLEGRALNPRLDVVCSQFSKAYGRVAQT